MATVLCTGWDQSLLDTRAVMLKSAGHEVFQARTQKEVASLCGEHQFDVAVIGHPISNRMKHVVVSVVREHCPDVKILELFQPYEGKALSDADGWLAVPGEIPGDLIERVNELATLKYK